jgi:predicted restriction endonuclease
MTWCEVHHFRQVLFGGEMTLDNGMLVCAAHHRMLHEGRWSVEREGVGWRAKAPPAA